MSNSYEYIPSENLKGRILDISKVNVEIINTIFMTCDIEVIYITDNDELIGIITPGDLIRYYYNRYANVNSIEKRTSFINNAYSSISKLDYEQAQNIFEKLPKVNEVPVVMGNIFAGIVWNKRKKDKRECNAIRNKLNAYTEEAIDWYCNYIYKFFNKFNGINIYLYKAFPNFYDFETSEKSKLLANKINDEINQKYEYKDGSFLSKMKEHECKAFFKDLYSQEYIDTFIADKDKLIVYNENGINKVLDISSTNFTVKNSYRVTKRQFNKQKKIFFLVLVYGSVRFAMMNIQFHHIYQN